MKVLMLERGPWWGPAGRGQPVESRREFPRGAAGVRKALRGVRYARGQRGFDLTLHRDGLFELHVFDRLSCAVASGVGGGSLVYTNMQVQPEDDFFEAFPVEITADEMRPHYEAVREMLRPRPVPDRPAKARAFDRALQETGLGEATYPDLAIAFGDDPRRPHGLRNAAGAHQCTSTHAGTCILGCEDLSKTTLDLTYLPLAERCGAQIRSLCEATALGRVPGGYAVRFTDWSRRATMVATAPRVVLAAGTLGTLRLLFAARDRQRTLPDLPAALGKGFTPNGDMAAWVDRAAAPVDSSHGPSACAYHQVRDSAGRHRHLVAEVGLPLAALPAPRRVRQRLSRSLVLFGMGRDGVAGDVRFDGRRLRIDVDRLAGAEFFSALEDTMCRIGAGYRPRRLYPNAPYRRGSRSLVSVHPLGGARLADSLEQGVVDHTGEVFGHRGLFVADGSLYPAAPGLPPSMTIAALAERESGFIAESVPESKTPRERSLT
jgi:cholesterol oxidase